VTMMTSHWSQPSDSISAREVGRNAAGDEPTAFAPTLENTGAAVCTAQIKADYRA
jgi:hypothetical protein